MRLRQLFTHSDLLEMAASSSGGTPGPGPGGPPSSPPSTPVPTLASTARVGDAPPGGGAGLSGQGNFKPANGIFIGKSPAEERHDYTAKSVIGKGIEWPKPNGAAQDSVVHKDDELESHDTHVGDEHAAVSEDADASSTSTADIATVSYPLFVNGATRRAKRRNARRAVGQKPVTAPSYIGKGVFEGKHKLSKKVKVVKGEHAGKYGWIREIRHGAFKGAEKRYYVDVEGGGQANNLSVNDLRMAKDQDVAEAHTLNSDNVIYRLDRENPMSNTEVAVIGGAGRYTLSGLRDKARKEAKALSDDLTSDHGGSFRGAAHNIKQLTNTLNTIVAAYNELRRIRSRGGRGSRGITDEDTNFIRECMTVVEQWHTIQGKK